MDMAIWLRCVGAYGTGEQNRRMGACGMGERNRHMGACGRTWESSLDLALRPSSGLSRLGGSSKYSGLKLAKPTTSTKAMAAMVIPHSTYTNLPICPLPRQSIAIETQRSPSAIREATHSRSSPWMYTRYSDIAMKPEATSAGALIQNCHM